MSHTVSHSAHHYTDIDECTYTTPCAQLCHNTNGSYYCSCVHGFTSDGPYCVNSSGELSRCLYYVFLSRYHVCCDIWNCYLVDGDAWLLYSDRLSLRYISTDSSHINRELIGSLNYPISMDYHYQYVCLSVCVHMHAFVYSIVHVTCYYYGFSNVTHLNRLGYVFWTDYAMKKIQRAHLNGSGPVTTVIDRGLEQPTGN